MCVYRAGLSGAGDCFRLSSSRLTTHAFTSIGPTLSLRPHTEQSRMSAIRNDANIVTSNPSRKPKTPIYPFSPPPTFVLPATTQSCLHQSYQAPARCFARLSICSASLTEDGCTVNVCFPCKHVGTYLSFRNLRISSWPPRTFPLPFQTRFAPQRVIESLVRPCLAYHKMGYRSRYSTLRIHPGRSCYHSCQSLLGRKRDSHIPDQNFVYVVGMELRCTLLRFFANDGSDLFC
jgi:hypothetical protein